MGFIFYSHPTFEPWDWTNPENPGIGGSETSHVEMARRLQERGHDVTSYSPIGELDPDKPGAVEMGPAGVPWIHSKWVDYTRRGVWVVYRHPAILDHIPSEGNSIWLICQDVEYGDNLTEDRAAKLTRLVALCETHAEHLRKRYPYAASKVCVSGNGIKIAAPATLERNPKRLMYPSSPDRGLIYLLAVFGRVKEIVPDAELHIYYGWDNIDKVIANGGWGGARAKATKDIVTRKIEETGAVWHGRTPQRELAKEWMKSGIWCHPSNFTETGCIVGMEAQAYGAIPITNPVWAVGEHTKYGVLIDGDPENEPLVRAKYVLEVVKMMLDPERQEAIREEMMPWAAEEFCWCKFAKQWEKWAEEDVKRMYGKWASTITIIQEAPHTIRTLQIWSTA